MRLQPDRLLTKRVDPLVMKTLNAIELLELIRKMVLCPERNSPRAAASANQQCQIRWTR